MVKFKLIKTISTIFSQTKNSLIETWKDNEKIHVMNRIEYLEYHLYSSELNTNKIIIKDWALGK